MSESTEVVSIEEQVKRQLALQQEKSAQMQGRVNLISFKGGQLLIGGTPIPNSEADVIVLANQFERAYYPGAFDPSKPQVPACYSFDGREPHPTSSDPQSAGCETCAQDAWGSKGRGKACREGARVMVAPSNIPLERAPMYQASFPITSVGSVREYFDRCANSGKLSGQFLARLKVVPDAKSFFKASLTMLSPLTQTPEELAVLLERMEQARKILVEPYPDLNSSEAEFEKNEPAPETKGKGKKY